MQEIIIQKLVLPERDRLENNWSLFYRANRLPVEAGKLVVPENTVVDFATYFNGCAIGKWREYTCIGQLYLTLRIKGSFSVNLTGYTLDPDQPVRRVYASRQFHLLTTDDIRFEYPTEKETFLAFEIVSESVCVLEAAYYSSCFEEKDLRRVDLAIATTTFRKEEYILNTVRELREELLNGEDEIRDHLYILVTDNGRTLKKEDVEGNHIRLFHNNNVGGAGGYSRGMYEAVHMKPDITHVLLMDDDVMVLPESIRKTYILLRTLKEEYSQAFVSGAMLEMDAVWRMHEDTGIVKNDKSFYHLKPILDVRNLDEVMLANADYPRHRHTYAGWWYCCIPAATIKEKGYALPLFIRGDDVEYGLRCNPKIMTMTGICIWHMTFNGKYTAATNLYQEFRNMLIVRDCCQTINDVDVYGRWKSECLRAALTYDYKGWELLLLAMEDYLKGPSFIAEDHGTELLERNKAFREDMVSFASSGEVPSFYMKLLEEDDVPMSFGRRLLYYLTCNGQKRLKKTLPGTGVMRYDWDHKPGRNAFLEKLYVVNPVNRTGCIRTKDLSKFRKLYRRERICEKRYKKEHQKLERLFRKEYMYLTSEAFWVKYLRL